MCQKTVREHHSGHDGIPPAVRADRRAIDLDLGLATRHPHRGVEPLGAIAFEPVEVSRPHASLHGPAISKSTHAIQSSQKIASLPPPSVMF